LHLLVVAFVMDQIGASRLMKQPASAGAGVAAPPSVENASRAGRAEPQAALSSALPITNRSGVATKDDSETPLAFDVSVGASFLLYGIAILVGLAASAVAFLVIYDVGRAWWHHSNFWACERKLKRVHEAFLEQRFELPLCPCCVEPLKRQASPKIVVFLCGHRFHTSCANAWFRDTANATRCPICVEEHKQDSARVSEGTDGEIATLADGGTADEAQRFILRSLHRRYPEFIPETFIRRWANCGTETWMQELAFPRYNSLLKKHVKQATSVLIAMGDRGRTAQVVGSQRK
jgi:uncharacterized membrane protein YphA (DoxX/SURF4 family)